MCYHLHRRRTGTDGGQGTNASDEATVTPKTGNPAVAWQTYYTPPTGVPAPVVSAAATVEVKTAPTPSDKSITITASRTTVSGKPGVETDAVVSGIEDSKTVIPYCRFPGETTYTQGSARPVITNDAFMWQSKTGKKFYAYVTRDDGAVTSKGVLIPSM